MEISQIIGTAGILGLIPAFIAGSKGHSTILWWLFGASLFIVALPCSILIKDISGKKCPQCTEFVNKEAKICKFCKSLLD